MFCVRELLGDHRECLAVRQMHHGSLHGGASDHVVVAPRADGIEPQRVEDVPGGHLPAVVVPAERVRLVSVLRSHDLVNEPLRLPRLAGVAIEIYDVVARLVPVPVLADSPLDVVHALAFLRLRDEEGIELRRERRRCRRRDRSAPARRAARTTCTASSCLR